MRCENEAREKRKECDIMRMINGREDKIINGDDVTENMSSKTGTGKEGRRGGEGSESS